MLQYGALVAEQDAAAALAYLRRAPEVIELADPDAPALADRFDTWYRGGMEVLAYNPEAARAYFAIETRKALAAIEEAASGIALRSVARMLKLFAEGLSGQPVTIRPLDEGSGEGASPQNRASSDGATIFLPARMRRYPLKEDNLRFYKVLTAHEAGHLEYGTYALPMARLADLASQAALRYGRAAASPPASLDEFFRLYPNPLLIRDLWVMAEDARVEACLKAEYPGLRRDMEAVAREEVAGRSLAHGLSVRELVVELLLQMSAGDPEEIRVPVALEEVVARAWALLRAVAQPQATAEDAIRAVHRAYVLIEELTAEDIPAGPGGTSEDADQTLDPQAGEEQGGSYRPLTTPAHRGAMDAERVREQDLGVQARRLVALAREALAAPWMRNVCASRTAGRPRTGPSRVRTSRTACKGSRRSRAGRHPGRGRACCVTPRRCPRRCRDRPGRRRWRRMSPLCRMRARAACRRQFPEQGRFSMTNGTAGFRTTARIGAASSSRSRRKDRTGFSNARAAGMEAW